MDNTSVPATPVEKASNNHLTAHALVSFWMHEYRRYLLDGDPNVLHPKARAALVLDIASALDRASVPLRKNKPKVTPNAETG